MRLGAKLETVTKFLPSWKNALLAVLSAVMLILAFPDFEFWFLAWFALVPLLWAIERETERGHSCPHEPEGRTNTNGSSKFVRTLSRSCGQECPRSFVLGWIFGVVFFFGTCWWLTYAPINYAAFPPLLAYFLLFCVTAIVGIFPGIFAVLMAFFLRRFGTWAFLLAPFVWVFTEFLRYLLTGNNWNAIGYSQAFAPANSLVGPSAIHLACVAGVFLVSLAIVLFNATIAYACVKRSLAAFVAVLVGMIVGLAFSVLLLLVHEGELDSDPMPIATIVAIQPNVPMIGMTQEKWNEYRRNHVRLAEQALATIDEQRTTTNTPTTVVFPESPMNFMFEDDVETQAFISAFAIKNNVSVLFNSAEPDLKNGKYYNSAVMVGPDGKEVAQYDKIYLVPFGEAVPVPFESFVPAFVGSFSYGQEHDLFPVGDAKAGVMICFESHFGQLSREFVRNGADVIIEMTNDGYLGSTPILRQHLANAVFRAVETNRPVLRVTNVGITAYINERGQVLDELPVYQEGTRVWSVSKSDGSQTFYVKYGDWFAWLCSVVTIAMLVWGGLRRKPEQ